MDSIRAWLEPGYDHGRTGVWLLEWPGAFTWGADRATALARVESAAYRFVDWLAAHGEQLDEPPDWGVQIVEEVAAHQLPDGYEVNATFAADYRAVADDELETQLRRLEHARADLLDLALQVTEFERAGGSLPLEERTAEASRSGATAGREADAVLRHIAGAETWFVSRLDPSARYAGERDDTQAYLAEARAFLIDGLRGLHAVGVGPRTDGKGESWTLAKVLRRALYHSLDHLEELDRRLALAERRAERVDIRRNAPVDLRELRRLFRSGGLSRRARDSDEQLARTLAGSTETVSAWDGERLVGFGRILSDEVSNAYISTVAIDPRWQDRGLGTRVMESLMAGRAGMKLVLEARPGVERFYRRLGFEPAHSAMVRPRGKPPGVS